MKESRRRGGEAEGKDEMVLVIEALRFLRRSLRLSITCGGGRVTPLMVNASWATSLDFSASRVRSTQRVPTRAKWLLAIASSPMVVHRGTEPAPAPVPVPAPGCMEVEGKPTPTLQSTLYLSADEAKGRWGSWDGERWRSSRRAQGRIRGDKARARRPSHHLFM